jgi:hypothetical protein
VQLASLLGEELTTLRCLTLCSHLVQVKFILYFLFFLFFFVFLGSGGVYTSPVVHSYFFMEVVRSIKMLVSY